MERGIACAAGSYKGVFVHGVLDAFERAGFAGDVYGAASSSTIGAAYAAAGRVHELDGAAFWKRSYAFYRDCGFDISAAVLRGIDELLPSISKALFSPGAARFAVAVSAVITKEAEELTQGPGARKLGIELVRATRTTDRSWADKNLTAVLFDSGSDDSGHRLGPENLREVAYATTRMLHAWKTPAWINGAAYVDASYTCSCPALSLAELGCREVVVVSPESGAVYTDFFQSSVMPASHRGVPIRVVQPSRNLAEIGVDYMKATDEGLLAAFAEGRRSGEAFLA